MLSFSRTRCAPLFLLLLARFGSGVVDWGSNASNIVTNAKNCANWNIHETACARKKLCPSSTSVIILHANHRDAEIEDSLHHIGTLLVFAEALCAKLLIPPPAMLLGNSNSNGKYPFHCSWEWSRYIDWPLRSAALDSWNISDRNLGCEDSSKALADVEAIESSTRQTAHDLSAAYDFYSKGISFTFTIATEDVRAEMAKKSLCHSVHAQLKTSGCVAKLTSSRVILEAAAEYAKLIGKFSILDIRRGSKQNSTHACNDSAPKIRMFATCQLAETPAIVFLTNDEDESYAESIKKELSLVAPLIVNGKVEVSQFLSARKGVRDVDQYLSFLTVMALRSSAVEYARYGKSDQESNALCESETHCAKNRSEITYSMKTDAHCTYINSKIHKPACATPCAKLDNVFVIDQPPGNGAGMEDRSGIMSYMSLFASALCAKLIVPPPCYLLGNHDSGTLNCSLGWKHYMDFGPVGNQMLEESMKLTSTRVKYNHAVSLQVGNSDGVLRTEIKRGDLGAAFDYYERNPKSPFIFTMQLQESWAYIDGNCNKKLRQQLRSEHGCAGISTLPSKLSIDTAEEMAQIFGGTGKWAVLHLRRGDTLKFGCDNSPLRVGQFLKCHIDSNYTAVFFYTDEQDPAYSEQVAQVIGLLSVSPIHGDVIARKLLEEKYGSKVDNYLVYSVFSAMKRLAESKGYLEMKLGKHTAEYCDLQVACDPSVSIKDKGG